jgi:ATP-dependent helicase/nuclease subunit B
MAALAADLLTAADGASPATGAAALARAQEAALRRAQEAARLAVGEGFRAWWVALLRSSTMRERARPGVAVIDPRRVAGRRFRRAYLVGAVAGAYDVGEREDYFTPEELRLPWPDGLRPAALPRRHRGLDDDWRTDLRSRGDRVVVTHADGDRGGPLRPDTALLGAPAGASPPPIPTASRLETTVASPFVARPATEPGGGAGVETLRRAQACAFRAWAAPLGDADPRAPWPGKARRALTAEGAWSADRHDSLAALFPQLSPWLDAHASALARLRFGVRLPGEGTVATLDAVERDGSTVRLVRFTLPDEVPRDTLRPDLRWTELWAADLLRRRHASEAARVDVVAWPLGGPPLLLTPEGVDTAALTARRRRLRSEVEAALARWTAGPPAPSPGFRCRGCPVADLCREGTAAA